MPPSRRITAGESRDYSVDTGYRPREDSTDPPDERYWVKAEDIVRQLTEPDSWWRRRTAGPGSPTYKIVGRYITGVLNLRGADLDMLLHFQWCRFEHRPDVREAQLLGLSFYDSLLPGLRARNLRCRNDLRIHRSRVEYGTRSNRGNGTSSLTISTAPEPGMPNAAVVLTDGVVDGSLVLTGSEILHPDGFALQGDRLSVAGALTAYRISTLGGVRLAGLRAVGNVTFSGSDLRNSHPNGIALNATGAHVRGSLLCEQDEGRPGVHDDEPKRFTSSGMIFLPGARIDGELRLAHAKVWVNPGERVLVSNLREAEQAGDRSADPWPSVVADRLRLDGNLVADGLRTNGTVRMLNAEVGGALRLQRAQFEVPRRHEVPHYDRAVHLDGSVIDGDLQLSGLQGKLHDNGTQEASAGQVRLCDVRIGGNLLAERATMQHKGRDLISARRTEVAGNVVFTNATLRGRLQLQGIRVGGSVELFGAQLTDPWLASEATAPPSSRNFSLGLRSATIGRDLDMSQLGDKQPFRSSGAIILDGATIARRLILQGAELSSEGGEIALDASDVVADEFLLTPGRRPEGRVILRRARCGTLDDNPDLWKATGRLDLEDFRYDALKTPIPLDEDKLVGERITQLETAMGDYRPGPYDQLAAMLRASGNEEHASEVLIRKQQRRYATLANGSNPVVGTGVRIWSWLQRALVAYGYRPVRALVWLALLLVVGSLWFGLREDDCSINRIADTTRCAVSSDHDGLVWNPVLFTADMLVPIVDLGSDNRWQMDGADQWVKTGFAAAGWILVTTVAAGVTRMLRRQ